MKKLSLVLLASSLLLGGCQTDNWGGGETLGTLGGAAAGGLVGNSIGHGSAAGTLTGVLLGGFLGNQMGGAVDDQDNRRAYNNSTYYYQR